MQGDAIDVMKNVFRPLCKSGMLLVINMADVPEGRNPTGEIVCQMCQCVDAMFEELEDEEDGGVVAGVLMGFQEEELLGPSIDPEDSEEVEVSLPVQDLMDDDEEGGWVFSMEEGEEEEKSYDDIKEDFGIFEDDEPVVELDCAGWTGLKSVIQAFKEATGKGSAPGKGGMQKTLTKNLKPLCKTGMLLITKNTKTGKSDLVCQLLQIMENVFEELEEDMGKVLCVLPVGRKTIFPGQISKTPTKSSAYLL